MNKKIKEKLGRMGYHRVKFPTGHPDENKFSYFWSNKKIPYCSQINEKDLNEIIKFIENGEI